MAAIKNKVLIQYYPLTATHTAGMYKSKICHFCSEAQEDVHNFLFDCHAIHSQADIYIYNNTYNKFRQS